eukprot:TRINITY_DN44256_c0_g2_i2.p1 TRINITY_DN44256_c0_g2~~TRINITY_DN44256_c0_g2_i2.p1  ORF type:complete len:555 (+),score=127.73 TRINITY_DN44256_c0_g2_i2:96-1667(+)
MLRSLVGSEMCIRDRYQRRVRGSFARMTHGVRKVRFAWPSRQHAQSIGILIALLAAQIMAESDDDEERPHLDSRYQDILGFLLITIGLFVAAGGGVGGGGFVVPIIILVIGLKPMYAIPLSNVAIFGSAVSNNIINLRKRHPHADRPLVDFEFALAMGPPTMAGAIVGTIVHKVTPSWLITTLLGIVLSVATYRTFSIGFRKHDAENAAMFPSLSTGEAKAQSDEERNPLNKDHSDMDDTIQVPSGTIAPHLTVSEESRKALGYDPNEATDGLGGQGRGQNHALTLLLAREKGVPWDKVVGLLAVFAILVLMTFLRVETGVKCMSFTYWLVLLLPIPFCLVVTIVMNIFLFKNQELKEQLGYPFQAGDVMWTQSTSVLCPLVCLLAGLFAGMFGVGGGIVQGPVMLEMGVLPEVAAATTAFLILFTAGSAAFSYAMFGMILWDFAAVLIPVGMMATLGGQLAVNWVIKTVRRSSYIIFIIAGVLGVSTILMVYIGVLETVEAFQPGADTKNIHDEMCKMVKSN